jgi:hypothetical protein
MKIKGRHQAFDGALIKKSNDHAKFSRIIQRSLQSVSVRTKQISDTRNTDKCNSDDTASELELSYCHEEDLVPQQQWDELFESAFEAISDTCIKAFDEQWWQIDDSKFNCKNVC